MYNLNNLKNFFDRNEIMDLEQTQVLAPPSDRTTGLDMSGHSYTYMTTGLDKVRKKNNFN